MSNVNTLSEYPQIPTILIGLSLEAITKLPDNGGNGPIKVPTKYIIYSAAYQPEPFKKSGPPISINNNVIKLFTSAEYDWKIYDVSCSGIQASIESLSDTIAMPVQQQEGSEFLVETVDEPISNSPCIITIKAGEKSYYWDPDIDVERPPRPPE